MERQDSLSTMNRRHFMAAAGAGAAVTSMGLARGAWAGEKEKAEKKRSGPELVKPPYAGDALSPHISAETLKLHFEKHHKGYYDLLVQQLGKKPMAKWPLEKIIGKTKGSIEGVAEATFYMAVLTYNHNIYWQSMKPGGGGKPGGTVGKMIEESLGGTKQFVAEFKSKAMELGAGWVWLTGKGEGVEVIRTDYHSSPIADGRRPLLTLDVWEHAYYLDYRDDREKYVDAFLNNLVNWERAEAVAKM